ncbi:MAG: hypothetical protein ACLSVX_02305 [Massilimicrobiota timonensis]
MKKTLVKIFACFAVLCMTVVGTYAASTSATCILYKGNTSAETSSVGVSKKSTITASHYSDSGNAVNVYHFCAWTGWPYTVEYSTAFYPKTGTLTHTEAQSRNSNFYLKLENLGLGSSAHVKGTIKAL